MGNRTDNPPNYGGYYSTYINNHFKSQCSKYDNWKTDTIIVDKNTTTQLHVVCNKAMLTKKTD